jgi:amino acid transporter
MTKAAATLAELAIRDFQFSVFNDAFAAEMVNFGACLGFILVNLSALLRARREWRRGEGGVGRLLAPLTGLVICAYIWFSLSRLAMQLGAVWCGIGILWLIVVTRGALRFRNHHP